MRKLKLSLDTLQVESFHATVNESARGTVPGHGWTEYADESCFGTCVGNCTRDGSCNNTCNASCYGTCAGTCVTCANTCDCPPNTDYTACGCQTWETCPNATICM
jgi:hypothetical protein